MLQHPLPFYDVREPSRSLLVAYRSSARTCGRGGAPSPKLYCLPSGETYRPPETPGASEGRTWDTSMHRRASLAALFASTDSVPSQSSSIAATIPQIDDIGLLLYDTIYVIAKGIDRCLAEEKWIYGVGKSRTANGIKARNQC